MLPEVAENPPQEQGIQEANHKVIKNGHETSDRKLPAKGLQEDTFQGGFRASSLHLPLPIPGRETEHESTRCRS